MDTLIVKQLKLQKNSKSKGLSETGEVDEKTGTALMSAIRDALKANDTQYKAL